MENILFLDVIEHQRSAISSRKRAIVDWFFCPHNDGSCHLIGRVITDTEEIPDNVIARVTHTSQVVKLEKDIAFTKSGSEYRLVGKSEQLKELESFLSQVK